MTVISPCFRKLRISVPHIYFFPLLQRNNTREMILLISKIAKTHRPDPLLSEAKMTQPSRIENPRQMGHSILYYSLRTLFNLKALWQRHDFDVWHYFSRNGDSLRRLLRGPHRRRELHKKKALFSIDTELHH